MKVAQFKWKSNAWHLLSNDSNVTPQICLLFGSREVLQSNDDYRKALQEKFPKAEIVQSSTAGNIYADQLLDDTIVATCIEFKHTCIESKMFLFEHKSGEELGKEIVHSMEKESLCYMLLLSTTGINAGNVLNGINKASNGSYGVSGGVAGDDTKFETTWVGLNENIGENRLVAVGFYGTKLKTKHGTQGGWDPFGPKRLITKAEGNVLLEVDQKPILDLYKEYLGPKASELPASALYFPLAVERENNENYIVRGVQDINEKQQSLILFGDVHEGETIQLMRANFDRVIDGAADSAEQSLGERAEKPQLALLISCVGRRIVLDQLVEEELSEVQSVLGNEVSLCGFYSYSELSPLVNENACQLHNQTMTITTFYEED